MHDQANISLTKLMGSGIICGLDIEVDDDFGISINAGYGITSNGQNVNFSAPQTFRYYKTYENTDGYPLFDNANVWQLTDDTNYEALKPQSSDEELNPFLRDKVALLFMEIAPESKRSRQGYPNAFCPVILIMEQSQILNNSKLSDLTTRMRWKDLKDDDDFIYNDDYNPNDTKPRITNINLAVNTKLQLPEQFLRRLGFTSGDPFNCPPEGVDTSVFPKIISLDDLYLAYLPVIDDAINNLDKAILKIFRGFGHLFAPGVANKSEQWTELLCRKWEVYQRQNEESEIETKHYIQYFYGWVRDLTQAYNELRKEIIELSAPCFPLEDDFPRHLLLGIVLRGEISRQPKPLRHVFSQPPVFNNNADRLFRIKLYGWRIVMMIKGFYLPDYVNDEKINPFSAPQFENSDDLPDYSKINVTPGRFYNHPLALQSIPYYYPLSWSRFSVHHFWNYERTKTSSTDQLLSYHASDFDDSYTQQHHVVRPLHYNLNAYNFYRIEGHIGKNVDEALLEIRTLKHQYNLDFGIVTIEIGNVAALTSIYKKNHEAGTTIRFNSFHPVNLGMEHIGGVEKGGTLILIHENNRFVADFSLPFNCCLYTADDLIVSDELSDEEKRNIIIERLGRADPKGADDLTKLNQIGTEREKTLNFYGVYTYLQLSKMTEDLFDLIDIHSARSNHWPGEAEKLMK